MSLRSRREFLKSASLTTLAAGCCFTTPRYRLARAEHAPTQDIPALETFSGRPRDRGRRYGRTYRDAISAFLERELYSTFIPGAGSTKELLQYAAACTEAVKLFSTVLHDELEGIAEGAAIKLEEVVLIMLHEELYHRGALPKVPHCTAVAVGPPLTHKGETLVGQTWDWMESVAGLSRVVHWQRDEGPSLLAYGFPGMFCGAGLNSAGLALCWTSAGLGEKTRGVRVGIPSYVLLTHFLYQESLDEVIEEARRATNAGWFTFVMGDSRGRLLNIEGSPEKIAIERAEKLLTRVGYGSREMTGTPHNEPVKRHARCEQFDKLVNNGATRVDARGVQQLFENPKHEISVGKGTIDMMVYDTRSRTAWLSRGPSYRVAWKRFNFPT